MWSCLERRGGSCGEAGKQDEALDKARNAFWASPSGRARWHTGDQVLQYSIDVMNQQAIVVKMVGSATSAKTAIPRPSSTPSAARGGKS